VEVISVVEDQTEIVGQPQSQFGKQPTVKEQSNDDAHDHQGEEAVSTEHATPQAKSGKVFREKPDGVVGHGALDDYDRNSPWLDDEQGNEIARHHQSRQNPPQAQIEEGNDRHTHPDGGDDGRSQAPLRKDWQHEFVQGELPASLLSTRPFMSSPESFRKLLQTVIIGQFYWSSISADSEKSSVLG